MQPRTTTLSLLALVLIVLEPAPLRAEERSRAAQADEHLARGLEMYEARDFEAAITAFLAGYEADPRPDFLFALGQAERRSGDCKSALVYYQRFLASRPSGAQVRATRMHIAGCRAALASAPIVEAPAVAPVAAPAPRSPWYHDAVGDVLLGMGTLSAIAGAAFLVSGELERDRLAWSATYSEHDVRLARIERHRLYGAISLGAGVALAAGAVYRFQRRGDAREVTIRPAAGGLALSYGGTF